MPLHKLKVCPCAYADDTQSDTQNPHVAEQQSMYCHFQSDMLCRQLFVLLDAKNVCISFLWLPRKLSGPAFPCAVLSLQTLCPCAGTWQAKLSVPATQDATPATSSATCNNDEKDTAAAAAASPSGNRHSRSAYKADADAKGLAGCESWGDRDTESTMEIIVHTSEGNINPLHQPAGYGSSAKDALPKPTPSILNKSAMLGSGDGGSTGSSMINMAAQEDVISGEGVVGTGSMAGMIFA